MRRTMKTLAGCALGAMWMTGCGADPSQSVGLEIQGLAVNGVVDGTELPPQHYTITHAERSGDLGSFLFDGPESSLQVSACPLGTGQNVDPYSGLSGEPSTEPSVDPRPDPTEGPRGERPFTETVSCGDRSISLCSGQQCATFVSDDVELTLREEGEWRRMVVDGVSGDDAVQIELVYRERR
ncbi:MAG: hypothetical protein J0L92_02570 [Deltaproteobacteria bacterium]|nr:hypothetical protein [Deltaproteobacteria bacterium]